MKRESLFLFPITGACGTGSQVMRTINGQTFTLGYDADNRMVSVTGPSMNASFVYDGNGKRVKSVINGVGTVFVGNYYEVAGGAVTKYYFLGSQRVALRQGGALYYPLTDHLGSTSVTTDSLGNAVAELRYKPWGETRLAGGTAPSKYQFTGQYNDSYINLLWYGSRHYDPELGRFIQPDSIVPLASQGVQAWDRYAYANNSPVVNTDPDGHRICDYDCQIEFEGADPKYKHYGEGLEWDINKQRQNEKNVETILNTGTEIAASIMFEPVDWAFTAYHCANGDCSPWMLAGLLPIIPSSLGSRADDIIEAGTGFSSFRQLKKSLGDAGAGNAWHHIVEQSQIAKSGFSANQIQNVENVIAVDAVTHRQISGFYNSYMRGTTTRVRDWLAGQGFQSQYEFGMQVLKNFGVIP